MRVTQDGKGSIEKQSNQRESPTSATVPRFTLSLSLSHTHNHLSSMAAALDPALSSDPLLVLRIEREREREIRERVLHPALPV